MTLPQIIFPCNCLNVLFPHFIPFFITSNLFSLTTYHFTCFRPFSLHSLFPFIDFLLFEALSCFSTISLHHSLSLIHTLFPGGLSISTCFSVFLLLDYYPMLLPISLTSDPFPHISLGVGPFSIAILILRVCFLSLASHFPCLMPFSLVKALDSFLLV